MALGWRRVCSWHTLARNKPADPGRGARPFPDVLRASRGKPGKRGADRVFEMRQPAQSRSKFLHQVRMGPLPGIFSRNHRHNSCIRDAPTPGLNLCYLRTPCGNRRAGCTGCISPGGRAGHCKRGCTARQCGGYGTRGARRGDHWGRRTRTTPGCTRTRRRASATALGNASSRSRSNGRGHDGQGRGAIERGQTPGGD